MRFRILTSENLALTLGLGVQKIEKRWVYAAELLRHHAGAFRAYYADEPRKTRIWDLKALIG